MLIKQRIKPQKIAGYEALIRRLPAAHKKRAQVQEKLEAAAAGYGGEKRLDSLLERFDPPYPYVLIQDLSLPNPYKCQIDLLLITRSRIVLLEVKNIAGQLRFVTQPAALHRVSASGEVRGFKSPVVQVEELAGKLEDFLMDRGIFLPVTSAIVIAYPNQIVEVSPHAVRVLAADEVRGFLTKMKLGEPVISAELMEKLGEQLVRAHREFNPFPLALKFGIELDELSKGIFCSYCKDAKVKLVKRKWYCPKCRKYSKGADVAALEEWFMLIKPTITARECESFLGLPNADWAKRLLKRCGLKESGGRKFRTYEKVK